MFEQDRYRDAKDRIRNSNNKFLDRTQREKQNLETRVIRVD